MLILWNDNEDHRQYQLVGLGKVCHPFMEGDLHICYKNIRRVYCALLGKLLWQLGNEQGAPVEACSFTKIYFSY